MAKVTGANLGARKKFKGRLEPLRRYLDMRTSLGVVKAAAD